jgi:hypothetical protein
MELESTMLSKKSQDQKAKISHVLTHLWNLDQKMRRRKKLIIIIIGSECMGSCLWGLAGRKRGEEDGSMLYMYTGRQCNETHPTLFERGAKEKRRNGSIMDGVNLFKVHCTHV